MGDTNEKGSKIFLFKFLICLTLLFAVGLSTMPKVCFQFTFKAK